MSNVRTIISIFGPSGAGKSTVAKALVDVLGSNRAVRVPGDAFLVPAEGSLDEYWQRPLAYDWPLLADVLTLPDGTVTGVPDFDFERFVRVSTSGGRELIMHPVRVVDTLIACPGADLRVRVSAPADVRRTRIIARDEVWGSRVIDRWEHLKQTQRAEHSGDAVDLELDGLLDPTSCAARIAAIVDGAHEGSSNASTHYGRWSRRA